MKFTFSKARLGTLALLFFSFAFNAKADTPKTCVISLLSEEQLNQEIRETALRLLEERGYDKATPRFDFFTDSIRRIRTCLEGDYEDVILLTHSSEIISGHQSLLYKVNDEFRVLDAIIFRDLKIKPTLRQITLITCEAEKAVEEYKILRRVAKENNVYIKLQPVSPTALFLTGTALRTQNLFSEMIAESAQDKNADQFYCVLRTNVRLLYEYGETSCLRNHYHVSYHGPLSVGLKTTTRVAKLKTLKTSEDDFELKLLEAELGFVRGIELGISNDPLEITRESYGFSFSPVNFFSITKVGQRTFGDDSD